MLVHHRADGDFTLSQSGAILTICRGSFRNSGTETEAEEYEMLRWILFDNHKLTSYTATARFMRHFRGKKGDPAAEFIYGARQGCVEGPGYAICRVATGSPPTGRRSPTSRCAAICSGPDQIGVDWAEYPAVSGMARAHQGAARLGDARGADALRAMTGRA